MAQRGRNNKRRPLRQDAIVERLIPDPSRPADLKAAAGFLGKSPQPGYWRLYLNPEFTEYIEFAEDDVVDSEPLPMEGTLGGTMVWLTRKATVQVVRVETQEAQAEFLSGGIAASMRGVAAPGMIGGGRLGIGGGAITGRTSFCDIVLCSLFRGDPCYTQYNCISRVLWPCV